MLSRRRGRGIGRDDSFFCLVLFLFWQGMDCWMLELTTDSLACLYGFVSVFACL
jgi:hypothetical protein